MKKYKWSLYKSIEYLNNRRPDLEIRASFINQLSKYEKRLYQRFKGIQTENWTELSSRPGLESEELIITNTFLNSQIRPFVNDNDDLDSKQSAVPKVKFIDDSKGQPLVTHIGEESKQEKILNPKQQETAILKHVIHIHPKDYNFIIKEELIKNNKAIDEDIGLDLGMLNLQKFNLN